MNNSIQTLYRRLAITGMRRCLSRLDKRPWSPTYGCFDRDYWHYKTISEFPRANFQQAVWALALLYKHEFPHNPFAGQTIVLDWIRAALLFWTGMRHRDGSVDEWFVNERSFCATAFNTAAVAQTLLLVRDNLDRNTVKTVTAAAMKSADWLVAHPNRAVANQSLAAGVALCALQHPAAADWLTQTLAMQTDEGWFPEYNGADFGYSLLQLDLLAVLYHHMPDDKIQQAARNLLAFLEWFAQPDGVIGGDIGSRNTWHGFVHGLEHFQARSILGPFRSALHNGSLPGGDTVDDNYASYFYINSICLAATLPEIEEDTSPSTANSAPFVIKQFPRAGMVVCRSRALHAVINTQRGLWRVWTPNKPPTGDAGYVAITGSNERWTSAFSNTKNHVTVTQTNNALVVEIQKSFAILATNLPLRRWIVLFKIASNWLLGCGALRHWFLNWIKHRAILDAVQVPLQIKRLWRFESDAWSVEDELIRNGATNLKTLYRVATSHGPHSPSSLLDGCRQPTEQARELPAPTLASLRDNGRARIRIDSLN